MKDLDRPGDDAVRRKNLKSYVPIEGIICLLKVQENLKEHRLPHGCNLLEHLGLKGSGPCTMARPEPIHYVMKRDGCSDLSIQKAG